MIWRCLTFKTRFIIVSLGGKKKKKVLRAQLVIHNATESKKVTPDSKVFRQELCLILCIRNFLVEFLFK